MPKDTAGLSPETQPYFGEADGLGRPPLPIGLPNSASWAAFSASIRCSPSSGAVDARAGADTRQYLGAVFA